MKQNSLAALGLVLVVQATALIIINTKLLKAVRDVEPSVNSIGDVVERLT